ncbi:MAG: TIGR04211 family SH3 domain-containing protein [Desulfobacterales bacterium]|jgi:SH3 domain protein|nr:TIGR04211 family SH3 domain-containing protein [Desulfobacterales bacterium]
MKALRATMVLLAVMCTTALAESFYVNDVVKVTLRSGPGYDHKILAVLNSGDPVELVERGKDWSRVRVPDGPEGWMATRLLTQNEPNTLKIKRLEARLAAGETHPDMPALETENKRLEAALAEARLELAAARQANSGAEGQTATADNGALADAKARIQALETRLAECQDQLADQTLAVGWRWFLAGAGVLLVGMLIGLKIQRRHRSGLL